MKYALLIYDGASAWEGLSEHERDTTLGEYFAVGQTPGIVGGEQLHTVEMATTVRLKDGDTADDRRPVRRHEGVPRWVLPARGGQH